MNNKLEWSFSALSTLRQCNRMYYFQYLAASHHFKTPLRRRAHELKKSKNLLMWLGSIVDKIMETEVIPKIKDGLPLDFSYICKVAFELANRQFSFSEEQYYKLKEYPESKVGDDYCILDIHDTNVPFSEEELIEIYSLINDTIMGIPSIMMPDGKVSLLEFLSMAKFMAPNVRSWSFEFENIKINPQLDLLMFTDNKAVVVDWKVSSSEVSDYSRQLILGGITVFDTQRKRALENKGRRYGYDEIQLLEVNLFKREIKEHVFNRKAVDECIDYVYLNSDDVSKLTDGQTFEQLDVEDFPMTDKESTCLFCKFRSLCINFLTNNNQYNEKAYYDTLPDKQFA